MNRVCAVIIVMLAALFPFFLSSAEELDLLKNPPRYIGTPEAGHAVADRQFQFWAQAAGHDGSVAGVRCLTADFPDSENPQWSCPRRLTDRVMMCKPVVLSTGEWVLPFSSWKTTDHGARMVVSKDSVSGTIKLNQLVSASAEQQRNHIM